MTKTTVPLLRCTANRMRPWPSWFPRLDRGDCGLPVGSGGMGGSRLLLPLRLSDGHLGDFGGQECHHLVLGALAFGQLAQVLTGELGRDELFVDQVEDLTDVVGACSQHHCPLAEAEDDDIDVSMVTEGELDRSHHGARILDRPAGVVDCSRTRHCTKTPIQEPGCCCHCNLPWFLWRFRNARKQKSPLLAIYLTLRRTSILANLSQYVNT